MFVVALGRTTRVAQQWPAATAPSSAAPGATTAPTIANGPTIRAIETLGDALPRNGGRLLSVALPSRGRNVTGPASGLEDSRSPNCRCLGSLHTLRCRAGLKKQPLPLCCPSQAIATRAVGTATPCIRHRQRDGCGTHRVAQLCLGPKPTSPLGCSSLASTLPTYHPLLSQRLRIQLRLRSLLVLRDVHPMVWPRLHGSIGNRTTVLQLR